MRLALIADIHGNPLALDAVLDDIAQQGGVDQYVFLGDYAALGYDPAGVIARIADLPNTICVRGNTDRYTTTNDRPAPTLAAAQQDPALIPTLTQVAASFSWTHGYLTAAGWIDWLAALPLQHRLTLPDGTRLLIVHAAPNKDHGEGITPATSNAELAALVIDAEADLIAVGHTHWAQDRQTPTTRVINPGSVSNSHGDDLRAAYALLHANSDGYRVEFRRATYDIDAALAALEHVRHPALSYLRRFFEGRSHPAWLDVAPGADGCY